MGESQMRYIRKRLHESCTDLDEKREFLSDNELLVCDFKEQVEKMFNNILDQLEQCSDCDVVKGSSNTYNLDDPIAIYGNRYHKYWFDCKNLDITPADEMWDEGEQDDDDE